jgi:hypothetical protein
LIPKFKNSGYPETTVHPHKGEVSWSKTRAIKEAKFALKGRMWTGITVGEAYNYRIVRRR